MNDPPPPDARNPGRRDAHAPDLPDYPDELSTCSMAWLNGMRLDYFRMGAPFGRNERGWMVWTFFRRHATMN